MAAGECSSTCSNGGGATSRPNASSASARPATRRYRVSPPQEHSITPSYDWSERYQPVSYSIARSRSGTGAEFVGHGAALQGGRALEIYVDAVINHMTNFPSPGVGKQRHGRTRSTDYPGLYTRRPTSTRRASSTTTGTPPTFKTANCCRSPISTPASRRSNRRSPDT